MKTSIVIATYGGAAWGALAWSRAYQSALGQHAHEIIVEHYDRPGYTISRARNEASDLAKGDWLCFIDADDQLAPGYLAAMGAVGESETDDNRLLVPAVQYVRDGVPETPKVLNDGRPLWEINRAVVGTLVPAHLFRAVAGFPEEPIYEDWCCWLECAALGARLVDVPDAVYIAHLNPVGRNSQRQDAGEVYWRYRQRYEGRIDHP